MTLGTAGHIDHGKSALVEALTGVHPDRLAEEQRRGMTLDLGFGHFELNGASVGVVDVPGHERFIRTMLAGAAGVDLLLLVVAADAGVQPQTVEHFHICRLLGLPGGVIALTKCDLADWGRRQAVRQQIAHLVAGSFLEAAPVVEVSARTGAGLEDLRQALSAAPRPLAAARASAPARLPLDRAFAMRGFGPVATGTLLAGRLRRGDEVELHPTGRRLRVRGIQVHNQAGEAACAGDRTAVNLAGIETSGLARGMVLAEPGVFATSLALDVEVSLLPSEPAPGHRARVHWHLHTADTVATLLWLEPPRAGAAGLAQLRLAAPLLAAPGDRGILRQLSPPRTLAGARVLDPHPPLHRRSGYAAAAAGLRGLAAADADQALLWHLRRAGETGISLAALAAASGRRPAEVRAALASLPAIGCAQPPAAIAAEPLQQIEQRLLAALAQFQDQNPLLPGAALAQLQIAAAPHWLALASERLRAAGRMEALPGGQFRLPGRALAFSAEQQRLRGQLDLHFRQAGFAILPLPQALAPFPQPEARLLLQALIRDGELVECQPGWFVHAAAVAGLRAELVRRRAQQPRFSVAEFKQWTGLSRKAAIPLLEYLDRVRLTRRVGDVREFL